MNCKRCKKGVFLIVQLRRHYNHRHLPPYYYILPWQIKSIFIIFLYLHLSLVFLLKHLIFQGFPTFEFSFLFKVSSQIFSYFLMFFPAILVNPLVKQASLPTGFFNYSLSDILLPLHHQNLHGCKCSRLH